MLDFAFRYWRPLLLLALVLALFGAGYGLKARIDAREAAYAEAQRTIAERDQQLATTRQMLKDAKASAEANAAARKRNDEILPTIRRESAGRVDRAATADAATGLQDDRAALDAYGAAASRLRGKGPG